MYSPKIRKELIPKIYQIAKARGTRMTTLVNEILDKCLEEMEGVKNELENEDRRSVTCETGKKQD